MTAYHCFFQQSISTRINIPGRPGVATDLLLFITYRILSNRTTLPIELPPGIFRGDRPQLIRMYALLLQPPKLLPNVNGVSLECM